MTVGAQATRLNFVVLYDLRLHVQVKWRGAGTPTNISLPPLHKSGEPSCERMRSGTFSESVPISSNIDLYRSEGMFEEIWIECRSTLTRFQLKTNFRSLDSRS